VEGNDKFAGLAKEVSVHSLRPAAIGLQTTEDHVPTKSLLVNLSKPSEGRQLVLMDFAV